MTAVLDLDAVPTLTLPPLSDSLRSAVVTTRLACPFCGGPVGGLLSGCPEPGCRSREIAADERLVEQ